MKHHRFRSTRGPTIKIQGEECPRELYILYCTTIARDVEISQLLRVRDVIGTVHDAQPWR